MIYLAVATLVRFETLFRYLSSITSQYLVRFFYLCRMVTQATNLLKVCYPLTGIKPTSLQNSVFKLDRLSMPLLQPST